MKVLIGRFAPTPSGPLHLGSLVGALGSYLNIKAQKGLWRLRIDDLDPLRCAPGSVEQILQTLEAYQLAYDGPVVYQSHRQPAYQAGLAQLQAQGEVYPCVCSRQQIKKVAAPGPEGPIYPGTCRDRAQKTTHKPHSIRLKTSSDPVSWVDQALGPMSLNLQKLSGDFVVWRVDHVPSYHLATVVDEQLDQITEVVRGRDLVFSTFMQVHLNQRLQHPLPEFMHLPLALNLKGEKLSKQSQARPLPFKHKRKTLCTALQILGLHPPAPEEFQTVLSLLEWAVGNWDETQLARP